MPREASGPVRVLIIGPAPPLRGGVAAHTAGLHAALRRKGHDVTVIGYRRLYPTTLFPGTCEREEVAALGEEFLDTLSPFTWLKLRRWLAHNQADLIVVQWWHPLAAAALLVALAAVEAPTVVICHNFVPHERFPLSALLARRVVAAATTVVCHSRAVARQVLRAHARVAVEVCPMPMLVEPSLADVGVDELRSRLGIAGFGPVALFLGLVREYKGVDVLLEAWSGARLPSAARLVIAGESYLGRGVLEAMVAACARGDSVIVDDRYLPQPELWSLLSVADVLVLPYRAASQSGLLPLARAAGVKVLVSDAGGLAEAAADPCSRAAVFPSGDAQALRAALEETLGGERERRSRPIPDPVSSRADYCGSWQQLSATLERVVRGRRRAVD